MSRITNWKRISNQADHIRWKNTVSGRHVDLTRMPSCPKGDNWIASELDENRLYPYDLTRGCTTKKQAMEKAAKYMKRNFLGMPARMLFG